MFGNCLSAAKWVSGFRTVVKNMCSPVHGVSFPSLYSYRIFIIACMFIRCVLSPITSLLPRNFSVGGIDDLIYDRSWVIIISFSGCVYRPRGNLNIDSLNG